ncbi:GNAT family N-acetyltransferase [Shewanella sp. A3A]|nr:GNAT family N-acetyltransferase [Shewanella ferrihydritica]
MDITIVRYSASADASERLSPATVDANQAYATAVAELFYAAVHNIDDALYSPAQRHAWAPYPIDYAKWLQRLTFKRPWLALSEGQVVGFIELDDDGHIDCMYTAPNYQRCGIASALYAVLEQHAIALALPRLYVEASYLGAVYL